MSFFIRRAAPKDLPFLREMLYEALFVPEGGKPFPRTALDLPEIARYLRAWGRLGDIGLVAREGGVPVGAAWCRVFGQNDRGFGFVAEDVPELTVAVNRETRGRGIGTRLLKRLFAEARAAGYRDLSLSVDHRNRAVRLYRRLGFEVVAASGTSFTMTRALRPAPGRGRHPGPLKVSVARAMDASDTAIVPFLPYILQDSWELGSSPEAIVKLVRRDVPPRPRLTVLDLGCGKGPVSIRLAKELRCRCLGIDAIPEFVGTARAKALEHGVSRLCRFEVGDIREAVASLPRFDIIVLGGIGPVLGGYRKTLQVLSPHLAKGGMVVLDDGYVKDRADRRHPLLVKKRALLGQLRLAGMVLADEVVLSARQVHEMDTRIFVGLEKRCRELAVRYPGLRDIFETYIDRQIEENDLLEHGVVGAVMALKRADAAGGKGGGKESGGGSGPSSRDAS